MCVDGRKSLFHAFLSPVQKVAVTSNPASHHLILGRPQPEDWYILSIHKLLITPHPPSSHRLSTEPSNVSYRGRWRATHRFLKRRHLCVRLRTSVCCGTAPRVRARCAAPTRQLSPPSPLRSASSVRAPQAASQGLKLPRCSFLAAPGLAFSAGRVRVAA